MALTPVVIIGYHYDIILYVVYKDTLVHHAIPSLFALLPPLLNTKIQQIFMTVLEVRVILYSDPSHRQCGTFSLILCFI